MPFKFTFTDCPKLLIEEEFLNTFNCHFNIWCIYIFS
jgi:hypothetical protein